LIVLVGGLARETEEELWYDAESLKDFVAEGENIERLVNGELGSNLIFKYKTLGLTKHAGDLREVASETIRGLLADRGVEPAANALAQDLIRFANARMRNIFEGEDEIVREAFDFDVAGFSVDRLAEGGVDGLRFDSPVEYSFVLDDEQRSTIREYRSIYGASTSGISRTLSKIYVRRLLRNPEASDSAADAQRDLELGQNALSGLNPFA